ncbi:MAG TPA: hypothetical protein PKI01_07530 [Bacteroidales bacterium]|nr:hypothetical protein [Bacteroidales bacterium]
MKKITVIILMLICLPFILNAQIKAPDKEKVDAFLKSKTYVVLEENPFSVFNAFVAGEMKDIWTITPFEVITYEDFEKKMGDSRSSFLFVSQARMGKNDLFDYSIINLVMGDASKNLNKLPELCIVPVSYAEVDEESYEYRFTALIKFIDYFIRYSGKNPGKDIQQIVKENAADLKSYELWLVASDLASNVNNVEKIKKYYPYTVKITTADEIEKAISENNPKVALLHKVGPEGTVSGSGTCYKFIITAKEGKPLYFSNHNIGSGKPDALLDEDFKDMAK